MSKRFLNMTGSLLAVAMLVATPSLAQTLQRAKDVLPLGEVSDDSLVVVGDNFRYQIPPTFKNVEHSRSQDAYRGIEKGFTGDDFEVTFYALREPFEGDLSS